jgi:ribosomal-protein-alanine N-acetyltransferase
MMASPATTEEMSIERGSADDLDAVMAIMERAFGTLYGEAWTRSQCAGILPMSGVSLRLANDRRSGKQVGFSLTRSVADETELLLIAVDPDHQRRGVGRLLLDDMVEEARARGMHRAHLEVRDGNGAMTMYLAAGFAQIGRRRKYYHGSDGSTFDALTFTRQV